MNMDVQVTAIVDVCSVLEQHGIDYWLDCGSLLGIIREGRLLPWDDDADISCLQSSMSPTKYRSISGQLDGLGYEVYYSTIIGYISVRMNGVDVDVFIHGLEDEFAIRPHEYTRVFRSRAARLFYWISRLLGTSRTGKINGVHFRSLKAVFKIVIVSLISLIPKHIRKALIVHCVKTSCRFGGVFQKSAIPIKYFRSFKRVKFYESEISVPTEAESYLQLLYGEGWRTPKPEWKYYSSETHQRESGVIFIDQPWDYENSSVH